MYRSVLRRSLLRGHWVCLYVMQQCSPDPSGLIKAVSVGLYVLVLILCSTWEDPGLPGFSEICMCLSDVSARVHQPSKMASPIPPSTAPLFLLQNFSVLADAWAISWSLHEYPKMPREKKKCQQGSSKQSGGSRKKAGRCLCQHWPLSGWFSYWLPLKSSTALRDS